MSSSSGFTFLPLGALIQEFKVNGVNIVQGFHNADQYKKYNAPYFGETIGRVANRVSHAKIDSLAGKSWQLVQNNGPNSLHGGTNGYGKRTWDGPKDENRHGKKATKFELEDKHLEEGYPGTVEARVWYWPSVEKKDGKEVQVLEFELEAELVGDEVEETAIALTNHSYFNLAGANTEKTLEGTEITLSTAHYQVVDDGGIPKGPIEPYPGITAKKPFTLGPSEPDIDDCMIDNQDPSSIPTDTRGGSMTCLVSAYHPDTKIHLEVHSTEPAFQFYTGKYIEVPEVDGIPARKARMGFCVEPSRYVNAVNVDEWKKMVVVKKGQKFGAKIVYKGWQD